MNRYVCVCVCVYTERGGGLFFSPLEIRISYAMQASPKYKLADSFFIIINENCEKRG